VNFETERLIMRPYTRDDAAFVFDMYSRWEVDRFLPTPKPMERMEEAVLTIERWRGIGATNQLLGVWAITTRPPSGSIRSR
jgi:RimJ/RimL family protein N-acetyltransferase